MPRNPTKIGSAVKVLEKKQSEEIFNSALAKAVPAIEISKVKKPQRIINKKKRTPFSKRKRTEGLDKNLDARYHERLINDENGKIEKALEGGFDFVEASPEKGNRNAQDPSRFGKVVCQSVGNGVTGYVMRIPKELWQEDQAAKQRELDEKDKSLGVDKLPQSSRHCFIGEIKIDNSLSNPKDS